MAVRVKLSDIIDGLESQSDMLNTYLNKETGEIVIISEDDFSLAESDEPMDDLSEWEQESMETIREIEETDNYIALPSQFDINEYNIMRLKLKLRLKLKGTSFPNSCLGTQMLVETPFPFFVITSGIISVMRFGSCVGGLLQKTHNKQPIIHMGQRPHRIAPWEMNPGTISIEKCNKEAGRK